METTEPPPLRDPTCAHLFEAAADALLLLDETGTIKVVNASAERLFGYDRAELLGEAVDVLVPHHERGRYAALRERFCSRAGELPRRVELTARRGDGSDVATDVFLTEVDLHGARWLAAAVRRVAHRTAPDPGDLAAVRVETREAERRRIAHDIHDDTIQVLTAVRLRMQQLRRRIDATETLDLLARLEDDVDLAARRLRLLTFGLRPPVLDAHGLLPALRTYVSGLAAGEPIEFVVEDGGLDREPGPSTRWALFRIAQEALTNAWKHSGASRVVVSVETAGNGFLVTVADDGRGFEPLAAGSKPEHFGLAQMRERAESAGGRFDLEAAPGKGCAVRAWLPEEDS